MNFDLKNKKILITGSSGGIGKSLAKKFADLNSVLILTSSDKKKLNDLKNEFGDKHKYYILDLLDSQNILNNVKKISEDNKDIEILINNSGITRDNLLLRMNTEQWNEVINVNLNSNFHIIKAIIPNMIKNKKGKIIGITSVVALTGNPGQSNYTASKSGMISMYKSIALEVAKRNININLIAPGFINSPMTDRLNNDQKDSILDKIPMNRFGLPEDVTNLAVFLSSNYSSYITGQTFHVNGGMLMI